MTWCFRLRMELSDTSKLQCPDSEWLIEGTDPPEVVKLVSGEPDVPLADARKVALRGSGYASEADAEQAGQLWRGRLMRAFASIRVGADFGDRAGRGFFTQAGLEAFGPPGQRVLNDVHGLAVFECEPPPHFLWMGPVMGQISSPHERLAAGMRTAIEVGGLTPERQVAYDFLAASMSQRSVDARFALLMIAVESLIEPQRRAPEVVQHVDSLIAATKESGLPRGEVQSLVGSLEWLRSESIGQAGRRTVRQLSGRRYNGEPPQRFFTQCYELRSRLVHGVHPLPTRDELNAHVAQLEVLVADLLCLDGR